MKKLLAVLVLCALLSVGCGASDVKETFNQSEEDGILVTYHELNDGTWQCEDTTYQYRLELNGRLPNAAADSCYVVLTNNEDLSFEDVSESQFSNDAEDSKVMNDSVIVEMQ